MAWIYMLRCADGSYYVGSTKNLDTRLWQHRKGKGAEYTKRRLPVELVWCGETETVAEAFYWEKRIQGWSRAKREALIRGDREALRPLSRNRENRESGGTPAGWACRNHHSMRRVISAGSISDGAQPGDFGRLIQRQRTPPVAAGGTPLVELAETTTR
ncbi:GIY-YIG nuclease family protein [Microbacteriaceae bacterium VKM Ac-2854]|nr:GIY-YIG nuclease family protein [Microbacteriaceae bacterium VKM Ac-2854]